MALRQQQLQQLQYRNVTIKNDSDIKILARVASQKSTISRSNLIGFSRMATIHAYKNEKGGGIRFNMPGIGGLGLNAGIAQSELNQASIANYDQQEYEMMLSEVQEDGFIEIQPHSDRSYAVQGQISHISLMHGITGQIIMLSMHITTYTIMIK